MTGPVRATAVYVSNADSHDISVLRFEAASGALTLLQTLPLGGQVMPLAVSPDRRFLYAAQRSEPWAVDTLAIDSASGHLTRIGQADLPQSMAYLATDRSGRWLFSASYGGHCVAVSAIDVDGVVGACRQVLPTEPHAHAIRADPSNRFVLASSLGGGVLHSFRFDAATGTLGANLPFAVPTHPGASPRHFVYSRSGRFVYLLGELDAMVDVLGVDPSSGGLRTLQTVSAAPPGLAGVPWAADLHLSPDERFVYASERRSSTLAGFRVDAASGLLAPIGHWPTQAQPRGFAVTPDGGWLLAAGQLSHRLGVHRIDPASGALAPHGEVAVGQGPNWVECVALGG